MSETDAVAATATQDDESETPRDLDSRVQILWGVRALVSATVFGGIVGVVSLVALDRTPLWGVGAFAFFAVFGIVRAHLLYRSWSYTVREDSLFLERGVFTLTKTVAPYVRVQHIDTSRGPLERSIGLATLVVYTAGSRGADVSIPGLTPEEASSLQARLKELAIESEDDDAV
jgi:membrane protein YdbS with pleckstrin-like domain